VAVSTIELRNVSKVHGDAARPVEAVCDVDLSIGEGELFVLIGPSGCGKSTLLRLVAGVDQPSSGKVLIDGALVNGVEARDRDVAMVFQASALYPNMTVAQNIGFPLALAKEDRRVIRRRVTEMAEMLGISELLERRPGQLSGGQCQRVAMGRMLIRHPHLFLMDEPMSNLDSKLRDEMRVELVRIQRRLRITTVYVTHDQVEAMSMGHRLAVMRRGRIVQCGTPEELYVRPDDLFVAQFLGSPPMNAWRAFVGEAAGAAALRWGAYALPLDDACAERFGGLEQLRGREVIVGLRPEAFTPHPTGALTVSPSFTEQLGAQQLVHCSMSATAVRAADDGLRTSADDFAPVVAALDPTMSFSIWEPLRLDVDLSQLHLFDPVDGHTLLASGNSHERSVRHAHAGGSHMS
jgi:multiple sugar transport system ATP-binding protein